MSELFNKKKPAISILDIVIVLIVVCGIGGALARYRVIDKLFSSDESTDVSISFIAEGLSSEQASAINDGCSAYVGGEIIGSIDRVTKSDALSFYENTSGILVTHDDSTHKDISASIKSTLNITENDGYRFNGKFIGAGSQLELSVGSAKIPITVISIRKST